jgi:ADP-heptose:LPS heptosyltransferase
MRLTIEGKKVEDYEPKRKEKSNKKIKTLVWRDGGYGDAFYSYSLLEGFLKKFPLMSIEFISPSGAVLDIMSSSKKWKSFRTTYQAFGNMQHIFSKYYDVLINVSPDPYFLYSIGNNNIYDEEFNVILQKQIEAYGKDFLINPFSCGKNMNYIKENTEAIDVYNNLFNINAIFSDAKQSITDNDDYKNYEPTLNKNEYITFHQWAYVGHGNYSTKFWPYGYWRELARLIKENFDIPIIQLGAARETFMNGEINNYLGKTNFFQSCKLIENSLINVDVEGSLIHAAALLNSNSIAITGPTSYYWRHNDLPNIQYVLAKNTKCDLAPCENKCSQWNFKCNIETHSCLTNITPEEIFEIIKIQVNSKII